MIHLAGTRDDNIVSELLKHFDILFKDQSGASTYNKLVKELKRLNTRAGEISSTGEIHNSIEVHQTYYGYASELLSILTEYVPVLLKNETFFAKAFY